MFRGAGGEAIPARGQKTVICQTPEGQTWTVQWEVCSVNRALMSVANSCQAGNIVHLPEKNPYIHNIRTGQVTAIRRERNTCVLDMWINNKPHDEAQTHFCRQD